MGFGYRETKGNLKVNIGSSCEPNSLKPHNHPQTSRPKTLSHPGFGGLERVWQLMLMMLPGFRRLGKGLAADAHDVPWFSAAWKGLGS